MCAVLATIVLLPKDPEHPEITRAWRYDGRGGAAATCICLKAGFVFGGSASQRESEHLRRRCEESCNPTWRKTRHALGVMV